MKIVVRSNTIANLISKKSRAAISKARSGYTMLKPVNGMRIIMVHYASLKKV